MATTKRGTGRREPVSPRTELPEELTLDVSELGPRALALIDWLRSTPGATVSVTRQGRRLAQLVAEPSEESDDTVDWNVEAVAP